MGRGSVQSPLNRDAPLAGISVIDCSVSVPAAFCTSLLQRLGAEVQTIVDVSDPPQARSFFLDEHLTTSPLYGEYLAHGKETVRIDLGSEAGRAELEEALSGADVLVEDWRVELLHALRIDPGALAGRKASLVIASVTPYGRTGPMSAAPASRSDARSRWRTGPRDPGASRRSGDDATPQVRQSPGAVPQRLGGGDQHLCCRAARQALRPSPGQSSGRGLRCHEAVANSFRQSTARSPSTAAGSRGTWRGAAAPAGRLSIATSPVGTAGSTWRGQGSCTGNVCANNVRAGVDE